MKDHTTIISLFKFVKWVCKRLSVEKVVCTILLVLSKTLDRCDRMILLNF